MKDDCPACEILGGILKSPGGVIFEDEYWLVDHSMPPVFIPGQLTCKLKRHCEHLAELTPDEALALGPLIKEITTVLQNITTAEKVHVASYGEGVRHIHFIITPRTANLPASNIILTFLLWAKQQLFRMGYRKHVYKFAEIEELVLQLRESIEVRRK